MPQKMIKLLRNNTESPVDIVISKFKEQLNSGVLKPGDKLPSERKLESEFGLGRSYIREALHKLEFYGIVKTLPQSGTVIVGLDINTLDRLISDVLNIQSYDFLSLVEVRILLEVNAIRQCAERRTDEDLAKLEYAHSQYLKFYETEERVSHDFAFHRAIAEGSHNPVVKAMLMIVIPDIMAVYQRERICDTDITITQEHQKMLDAIKASDGDEAAKVMSEHLQGVLNFAKTRIDIE